MRDDQNPADAFSRSEELFHRKCPMRLSQDSASCPFSVIASSTMEAQGDPTVSNEIFGNSYHPPSMQAGGNLRRVARMRRVTR